MSAEPYDDAPDDLAQLVTESHRGDADAQRLLVARIGASVRAVARRTVRDPHDAEDLSQSIFLAVFRGLATYRGEAHFRAWLQAVARNEARKFLRTRMRREDPVRDAVREPDTLPARAASDPLAAQRVGNALEQLADDERSALEQVVFDGRSYAEAGRALGCSAGAIRGRVYRARQALRRWLEDH
ncbi:MAG: RNA polymerase sigma factor [Acidobacteriota bacterium]